MWPTCSRTLTMLFARATFLLETDARLPLQKQDEALLSQVTVEQLE